MCEPNPFFDTTKNIATVTADSSSSLDTTTADADLDEQLRQWREEQFDVASRVVVITDDDDDGNDDRKPQEHKSNDNKYKLLPQKRRPDQPSLLYGGVDVSFPETEGDPAVAMYVVMNGNTEETVYEDYELFELKITYVSSYLSFREIDPLERLIKKQMKERPDVTPEAILVDGNGILHKRSAGIACFVGVRTGIKTIGVGKTMYHHDGLTKDIVKRGMEQRVKRLLSFPSSLSSEGDEIGLIVDCDCIDGVMAQKEKEGEDNEDKPTGGDSEATTAVLNDMKAMMGPLSDLCSAFAVKLKGSSGQVWGAAMLGHGGKVCANRERRASGRSAGTKNPIFVSVGHLVSLQEAVQICAELSNVRIPEPVRRADLYGRELMRKVHTQTS